MPFQDAKILIADSGSTKTTWAWVEPRSTMSCHILTTEGLNPRTTFETSFVDILGQVAHQLPSTFCPSSLVFYGAGCGTKESKTLVNKYLHQVFPQSSVLVESDLLGACHALCGSHAGMVGILGTGSNACLFDGRTIVRQPVSLGYILGDEGSGNHIGRQLLKGYFSQTMPKNIRVMFHDSYDVEKESVLDHLYRQSCPNRYLASFAPFAQKHHAEPYIQELLVATFREYLHQQVLPLADETQRLNLVGSVATAFASEIVVAAHCEGIEIGTVMSAPMDGLIKNLNEILFQQQSRF